MPQIQLQSAGYASRRLPHQRARISSIRPVPSAESLKKHIAVSAPRQKQIHPQPIFRCVPLDSPPFFSDSTLPADFPI